MQIILNYYLENYAFIVNNFPGGKKKKRQNSVLLQSIPVPWQLQVYGEIWLKILQMQKEKWRKKCRIHVQHGSI